MEFITIKDQRIYIDFRIQSGSIGKPFKLIGLSKNLQKPSIWVDRTMKWHWVYLYKYIEDGKMFEIEIDYYDRFFEKRTL